LVVAHNNSDVGLYTESVLYLRVLFERDQFLLGAGGDVVRTQLYTTVPNNLKKVTMIRLLLIMLHSIVYIVGLA
jgi:hypothetical protein